MPEGEHADDHGQHLARDRDRDQHQAAEACQRRVDEDLAHGTAQREREHVGQGARVLAQEIHG